MMNKMGNQQNFNQKKMGGNFNYNQQDKFYTTKQGKRFKQSPHKMMQTPYLKNEICKFFTTNSCHRGADCNFSHNLKDFPCKFIHGTGYCDKGQNCKYSHNILNEQEIMKFMEENEDYLTDLLRTTGKTNLGEYFLKFLRDKDERMAR